MEEVQSWWEVPAVAHFCYAFRSAFNLVFFEIAELESALLDMQDPDMCLSLEQLIMRILQGFENEPVTEENWEETLDDLFSETLEDNENPLDKNLHFLQLSARKKLEVLFKLCELRLDVKDAIDAIKDIASKDMNATCLGKDSQNNSYWYFYDERLYKEATSSSNGKKALQNVKDIKNASSKSKMVNIREKRTKSSIDSSWSIVCYSLSDWEKLIKTLSKSRNSHEKKLVNNMKEHLGVVQENVAEKDRLLRKRFIELAPKRTSSRISKVQEKKKLDEINAQKAAEKAKVKEEKEQAKKEAKRKKLEIIERQKRAEERRKAMEEAIEGRAARAKLREVARAMGSDDSDDEEENDDNEDEEEENDDDKGEDENDDDEEEEALHKRGQKRQASRHYQHPKYKSKNKSDSSEDDSSNESEEASSDSEQKSVNRFRSEQIKSKQTYYNRKNKIKQPETNGQQRGSPRLRNYSKIVKYKSNKESVSEKEDEVSKVNEDTRVSARLKKIRLNNKKQSNLDSIKDGSSCDAYSDSANGENLPTVHKKSLAKENSLSHTYSNGTRAVVSRSVSPRISHYKNTVLQNSSDVSKWNSTFDSKGQKLHILHDAYDNLSSKKLKLQQVKTFASSSQNLKSSLSKENKVYQPFHHKCVISYSKFSPTTIRLDFKKSSTTSF